jgi:uncharacterized membrane protein YdjX (TVP38/TMEM64 family)
VKKFLPLIGLVVILGVLYATGAVHYFSFEALRDYHQQLKLFEKSHPIALPLLFMAVYTLSTALSIPGALFLTLAAGYLFGQPLSLFVVVVSATCGATLLFLAARTALRGLLKKKAAPFLKKMEKGFTKNAASYLLFLRFVPLFPFWVVNLVPAFFGVRLRTFIWTTLVGIAPGSFVFTLAGEGLEKIFESKEGFTAAAILNPQLKLAFILLGVFALIPILLKKWKGRRD